MLLCSENVRFRNGFPQRLKFLDIPAKSVPQPVPKSTFHKVGMPTGNGTVARMASMTYGYARVSTGDQTADLQQDALVRAGCDRIFTDVASGAKAHRPELDHMLDLLREGDTVVVWKLDRLGRSLQNLVELIDDFDDRGVQFRSLTESIDTSTPGGILIFNIFGSLAQFERDLIRERTRAGLEAARARGRTGGRPTALDERQVKEVRRLYESRSVTVNQIASMMHVGRTTIYRCLQKGKEDDREGRKWRFPTGTDGGGEDGPCECGQMGGFPIPWRA